MCIVRWEKEKSSEAELKKKEIKKIHQKARRAKIEVAHTRLAGWGAAPLCWTRHSTVVSFQTPTQQPTPESPLTADTQNHFMEVSTVAWSATVWSVLACPRASSWNDELARIHKKSNNLITTVLNQRFCVRISIGAQNWLRKLCLRRTPLDLSLTPTGTWQLWAQVAKR